MSMFYCPRGFVEDHPIFPFYKIFQDVDWKLSDGSKRITAIAATLIATFGFDTVIEIGVLHGFSSYLLGRALECSAGENGKLISCDISPVCCKEAKEQTKDLSITHQIICQDSIETNFSLLTQGRQVGLAFIDGKHKYDWCTNDIKKCAPLLCENGFMVVHDNHLNDDVNFPVCNFIKKERWQVFRIPGGNQLGDSPGVILQKFPPRR